jgi:diguanylate cyclase (GGDEF)-like protein
MESFRQSDLVGKFGGDEFQILMLEATREKVFEKLKLIEKNAAKLQVEGASIQLEFSFGLARFPDDGKTKNDLFKTADRELYRMKNLKKNL